MLDQQALYRCYRYGQVKPVYAYRFLTEGTMEEKVYSRSVNKTSLAARVIDQKDPKRNFTQRELSDIMAIDTWVRGLQFLSLPLISFLFNIADYIIQCRCNVIVVINGGCSHQ